MTPMPNVFRAALCTLLLPTAGCVLNWDGKKQMQDAATGRDSGMLDAALSGGPGPNNAGSDAGANADADGDAGSQCTAESCNGRDDDCDRMADEGCAALDDCASLPCKNGATCKALGKGFACTCTPGYEGATCDKDIDDCAPNPCQNGGTCSDRPNGFECTCPTPTTGAKCELKTCPATVLASRADIDANRLCATIEGDLSIRTRGFASLTETDFPYLRTVTGALIIAGGGSGDSLRSVTFGTLEVIGRLDVSRGPVDTLSMDVVLPALRTVGNGEEGVWLVESPVRSLIVPSLTTVKGNVWFLNVNSLCSVDFRRVTAISGSVDITAPALSYVDIKPLINATPIAPLNLYYNCCEANSKTCGLEPDPAAAACICGPIPLKGQ